MTNLDNFKQANAQYAAQFDKGALPMPPKLHAVIVICMDARLDPAKILGLHEGDAHVIRNAGGRVTEDTLRSLIISQQLLGTREVYVIHHTDCGMVTFTDDQLHAKIQNEMGLDASHIHFLPFSDLEQSVREDVATIKASPFIPTDIPVTGYVYDVKTGQVTPVSE